MGYGRRERGRRSAPTRCVSLLSQVVDAKNETMRIEMISSVWGIKDAKLRAKQIERWAFPLIQHGGGVGGGVSRMSTKERDTTLNSSLRA